MNQLISLIYDQSIENWTGRCKSAFEDIFGALPQGFPQCRQKKREFGPDRHSHGC